MKASKMQIRQIQIEYETMVRELIVILREYGAAYLEVVEEHDFKNVTYFEGMGREAVLYKLKQFLESRQAENDIMLQVKSLINDKYQ